MKETRRALGKGLEQLFSSEQVDFDAFEHEIIKSTPKNEIVEIPLSEIRSNPYQPRIHFDEEALNELAESIKESGVLSPILVKKSIKGYELIAGERRTKASRLAGLETIPAIIKDFTDQEMMEIAILENTQREDLSPIEEAQAYKNYMEMVDITQEELANKFKKSRSYITNLLGLLKLPKDIQRDVTNHNISMSHARVLSKLDDSDQIEELANKIKSEGLSVRELEELSQKTDVKKKNPIKTKHAEVSSRYRIYENVMREKIGNRISIKAGKIIIPFDTDKDLDRIMEILDIEVGE
ncbi:MAG: ParB/RepB/Spo0J family partition protein [Bacilli bacterium]|nr:ParB/RepB/Spo0J family partition protein [Bacilli bacterium]